MRLLLLISMCLFSSSTFAQRNIFDGFDDNSNEWPVTGDLSEGLVVKDGMYWISSSAEGYWYSTKTVTDGMNDHFRIEASVMRLEGTAKEKGAGITWGNKGDSVRMEFIVYGDGSFVFRKIRNGQTQTQVNKSISFNIFEFEYNNLRVERNMETNMYDLSINEQLVLSAPFEAPLSSEVGLYCDVAGKFCFDNFWFIEKGNTTDSYIPGKLFLSDSCAGYLNYRSDYGFNFCVPLGWRVDNYKETHWSVWPVGAAYQINMDFAKLSIEDSFAVAARNDFKIFTDSMKMVSQKVVTPMWKHSSKPGVQVFGGEIQYTSLEDKEQYVATRYYVFHESTGSFLLVELITLRGMKSAYDPSFDVVARTIAETIRWE